MSASAPLGNTPYSYGKVTKFFHWLTALLILTLFPLGLIANGWPYDTTDALLIKGVLFSLHKTLGITTFAVALARILWALFQTKPQSLNPDRKFEHFMAELAHWTLYAGLVLVPLSGWLHHAATTGFAPIWWPFGQSLPFVPKDDSVAHLFAEWHYIFTKVLGVAVLLHIAGALKHQMIDRDLTLARMLPGSVEAGRDGHDHSRSPFWAALLIWAAAITAGSALGWPAATPVATPPQTITLAPAPAPAPAETATGWTVDSGTLGLSVVQFGSEVSGSFSDWTATIDFDPDAAGPELGNVSVDIAVGSVTLGSVTAEAVKPEFFDADTYPTARFTATILSGEDGGYLADGVLSLKGADVPVALPFTLTLDGDQAKMTGSTVLDRRDFGIGTTSYGDEGTLGFPVTVSITVTATRG